VTAVAAPATGAAGLAAPGGEGGAVAEAPGGAAWPAGWAPASAGDVAAAEAEAGAGEPGGGEAGGTGSWAGAVACAVAADSVTGLAAELRADPATFVTALAAPVTEVLTAAVTVVPAEPGLAVSEEDADVPAGSLPGWSSRVAAWACLEKRSRRKRIPAAATANCAARMAARYASSCVIASSHPQGNRIRARKGQRKPRISHARPLRTRRSVRPPTYIAAGNHTSPRARTITARERIQSQMAVMIFSATPGQVKPATQLEWLPSGGAG